MPKSPGEQRRRERKRQEVKQKLQELRTQGKNCGNCKFFNLHHPYPSVKGTAICDHHTDFHGYVTADPGGVCTDWEAIVNIT